MVWNTDDPRGLAADRAPERHRLTHVRDGEDALDLRLLDAYDGDPADPQLGDVIVAQTVAPRVLWKRYPWTAPAANVRKVFGGDNGETVPTYKNALDATLPVIVTPGGAGAAGTSLIFSHRDHNHPATDVASAASLATVATLAADTLTALNAFIALEYTNIVAVSQQLTSNSTTFQNVTNMIVPITGTQVWRFAMTLIFISTVAADFKFQFTVPAGATLFFSTDTYVAGGAAADSFSLGAATGVAVDGAGANVAIEIRGTVICGGTAGNLQLQAAQNVATVEAIDFVVAGSNVFARRVA